MSEEYSNRSNVFSSSAENSVGITEESEATFNNIHWNTQVEYGEELQKYTDSVSSFQKRDCFDQIREFLQSPSEAKVCALYGLRRTGKTTLLYQTLAESDLKTTAYIKLKPGVDMWKVEADLSQLKAMGVKTILIDEITYAADFAYSSNLLADHYAICGIKIILAGTDSLGFILASKRILYDRLKLIHTTFISFSEYSRLLGIEDIDTYIKYGGTLMPEGKIPFLNLASSSEYMNSAIVENIQHAFRVLYDDPDFYTNLKKVFYDNQLSNLINRVLDDVKHRFIAKILNKNFRSANLGALQNKIKSLMMGGYDVSKLTTFLSANHATLADMYKNALSIQDMHNFTQQEIDELQMYLRELDVITSYNAVMATGTMETQVIFTQPGMQYSQAIRLIEICHALPAYRNLPLMDRQYIDLFLENNIFGRILEDVIINHTKIALEVTEDSFNSHYDLFQYQFATSEFDMVVLDHRKQISYLFEIKHSSEQDIHQPRHLCNDIAISEFAKQYYPVARKSVLYTGSTTCVDVVRLDQKICFKDEAPADAALTNTERIQYINIAQYLLNINAFFEERWPYSEKAVSPKPTDLIPLEVMLVE